MEKNIMAINDEITLLISLKFASKELNNSDVFYSDDWKQLKVM